MDRMPVQDGTSGTSLVVAAGEDGTALLEFVSAWLVNESKARLRRMIGSGAILCNGRAARPRHRVAAGDIVTVPAGLDDSPPPCRPEVPIQVIYEDAEHLCVDKPAGHPVLPGRGGRDAQYYRSLAALLNARAPRGGPYVRPHMVHRLDRHTSGVLLVAKNVEAGRALGRQFESRRVTKTYLAVVEGPLPRPCVNLDIPLGRRPGSLVEMMPDARNGKPAQTSLRVADRFGHFTLLEVRPHTGRQHQIRVHLAAIGYPLAVDRLYGRRAALRGSDLNAIIGAPVADPSLPLMERCPLHAASISYCHPSTGSPMTHQAPLPDDMHSLLSLLQRMDPTRTLR